MKILLWIVGVLVALVLLLGAVGFLLPREVHIERSIEIDAPPAAIQPLVADLHNWPRWIPWNEEMDPTVEVSYSGAESGVGAGYAWKGEELGEGSVLITKSDPEKGIEYDLVFAPDPNPTKGSIDFEPAGKTTKVTWVFNGDMGAMPYARYFGLMLDGMLGADFEKGLANLKALAEKDAAMK